MSAYDDARQALRDVRFEEAAATDAYFEALATEIDNPPISEAFADLAERHLDQADRDLGALQNAVDRGGPPPAGDGSIGPAARDHFNDIIGRLRDALRAKRLRLAALRQRLAGERAAGEGGEVQAPSKER